MDESASSEYANKKLIFDFEVQVDANYKPGANPNDANAEKSN